LRQATQVSQIQPYFNRRKLRFLALCACSLFAILLVAFFLADRTTQLTFDWSFVIPTVALISGAIPIGSAVVDWFEKKLKLIDERLDALELSSRSFQLIADKSEADRHDLKGMILRLEARLDVALRENSRRDLTKIIRRLEALENLIK
jgi:hypothetical protein